MEEIWKPVKGYEGLYLVSNIGRIYGIKYNKHKKPELTIHGYHRTILSRNGTHKRYFIHRLVAEAFIPNPNNYPFINHIDENKTNNAVYNLEWCTAAYNSSYGSRPSAISRRKSKPVAQYDLKQNLIATYSSSMEAARAGGFDFSSIRKCCRGMQKKTGGYMWKEL